MVVSFFGVDAGEVHLELGVGGRGSGGGAGRPPLKRLLAVLCLAAGTSLPADAASAGAGILPPEAAGSTCC